MIRSFVVAIAMLCSSSWAFASTIEERVVDHFIVPAYMNLSKSSSELRPVFDALCAQPSQENLAKVREKFSRLVDAWSYAEVIRFGPIAKENRLERILFWPDRKSIGLKQIQRVISQKDQTAIALSSLQNKSVAVQGLGAIEFVLFGTGSEQLANGEDEFRCQFGATASAAVSKTSQEILADWQAVSGYRTTFTRPSSDNEIFRDNNETLREIMGVIAHGPAIIFDTRLKKYLGEDQSKARPKSALFWRSELSLKSISTNLRGLHDFVDAADIDQLLDDEQSWITSSYQFETKNGIRATEISSTPLEAVINDERGKLEYLRVVLDSLGIIAQEDLSQALGQSTGFSSLDGD